MTDVQSARRSTPKPAPTMCYACGGEIGSSQDRFVYELKNGSYPDGTQLKLNFHYEHRPQRERR